MVPGIVHADPDEVRALAARLRALRLQLEDSRHRLESDLCGTHTRIRGTSGDAILSEAMAVLEAIGRPIAELAALTSQCDRYALALDAYLGVVIPHEPALSQPEPITTVEFGHDRSRVMHHRAAGALRKLGIELWAIDLEGSTTGEGVSGSADLALLTYDAKWNRSGQLHIRTHAGVGTLALDGTLSRAGLGMATEITAATAQVQARGTVGAFSIDAQLCIKIGVRLGLEVGDAVARQLPFLNWNISIRRNRKPD